MKVYQVNGDLYCAENRRQAKARWSEDHKGTGKIRVKRARHLDLMTAAKAHADAANRTLRILMERMTNDTI